MLEKNGMIRYKICVADRTYFRFFEPIEWAKERPYDSLGRGRHKILLGMKVYGWKGKLQWFYCPDWSGKVIPPMWSQKGEEPRPGGEMTTSDRKGRARWLIVGCSAECLDCSLCSSSYAFTQKTQTLHYYLLPVFENSVCVSNLFTVWFDSLYLYFSSCLLQH